MNHLCGEGDFKKLQDQADTIPSEALGELRELALATLFQMPKPGEPSANYAFIRQEPGENFCQFIERLQAAVERQVDNDLAWENLVTSIANVNANGRCRQKIESLPPKPKPTLEQMTEVCFELESDPVGMVPPPPSQQVQKKKTIAPVGVAPPPKTPQAPRRCFNCGDTSYFAKNCQKPPRKPPNMSGSKYVPGPEDHCPCVKRHQMSGNGQ